MSKFFRGVIAGAVILIAGFCLVVLVIASNTGQSFGSVIRGWFPDESAEPAPETPVTEVYRTAEATAAAVADATLTVRLCWFADTDTVTTDVNDLVSAAARITTDGSFRWDDAGIARIAAQTGEAGAWLSYAQNRVFYADDNGGNIFLRNATVADNLVTIPTGATADAYVFLSRESNREITYTPKTCGTDGVFRFAEPARDNAFTWTDPATPHAFGELLTREPTCTTDGATYYVCTVCGAEAVQTVLPATGHRWSAQGLPVKPATHIEPGIMRYACTLCRETREEIIPATGHEAGVWRVLIEPDCTHAGKRERVCTCGVVLETETIAELGHTWGAVQTETPSCTDGGETYRVCTVCGERERIAVLPPTGHDWGEELTQAPNCTDAGETYHICGVCGERETLQTLSPVGHSYGPTQRTEATKETPGEEYRVCTVCGEKEVLRSWTYGGRAPRLGFLTVPDYLAWQITKGGAGFDAYALGFRIGYWTLLSIAAAVVLCLGLMLFGREDA